MEASVMERRLKKSEYEALRQRKMKEIEKRVHLRATSPPSSLFHSTSRNNSVSFKEPPPIQFDKKLTEAVLREDVYKQLKRTIKGADKCDSLDTNSDRSTASTSSEFHSFSSTGSLSSLSPVKQDRSSDDQYSSIVSELSHRGLTASASRRKLQATVKEDIEKKLTHNSLSNAGYFLNVWFSVLGVVCVFLPACMSR